MIAYTDYPIPELGDKFYTKAPMRECYVLSYDGENYCEVVVENGLSYDVWNIHPLRKGWQKVQQLTLQSTRTNQAELGSIETIV